MQGITNDRFNQSKKRKDKKKLYTRRISQEKAELACWLETEMEI